MKKGFPAAASIGLAVAAATSPASAHGQEEVLGLGRRQDGPLQSTFRNATEADVDDMTAVFLDAYQDTPAWTYTHLPADQVPDGYTFACNREAFRALLAPATAPRTLWANVISVPDAASRRGERVVSVGLWDLNLTATPRDDDDGGGEDDGDDGGSSSSSGSGPPRPQPSPAYDCSARLDVNETRAAALDAGAAQDERAYFTDPYGDRQLYLSLLVTHRDYGDRGFDAAQVAWGKGQLARLGRERGGGGPVPITTEDTGRVEFYVGQEGFVVAHNRTRERLDGEGPPLWRALMVYRENGSNVTSGAAPGGCASAQLGRAAAVAAWLLMTAWGVSLWVVYV